MEDKIQYKKAIIISIAKNNINYNLNDHRDPGPATTNNCSSIVDSVTFIPKLPNALRRYPVLPSLQSNPTDD